LPNASVVLGKLYDRALGISAAHSTFDFGLSQPEQECLDEILHHSSNAKGVLTVTVTSFVYKVLHQKQDVRRHQAQIPGGYAGRRIDTEFVTPFLKKHQFPAMAESGWLTRSLEQPLPYELDYPGKITPAPLKTAFLEILDLLEKGGNAEAYLQYVFTGLIKQRDMENIRLARPAMLPIRVIMEYLYRHFTASYTSSGASRLPVLAVYAVYQCLTKELQRFHGKRLLEIESHTSADTRSGRLGDIDVVDEESKPFESVEIKHNIKLSLQILENAYAKFKGVRIKRYYVLSTSGIKHDESEKIAEFVAKVKASHGCQLIINGVQPTIEYYLRLLSDPSDFIENYATLLENDHAIKFEHREKWNEIAGTLH
jgi:DNA (cytosine-5)-methyltransferase 1